MNKFAYVVTTCKSVDEATTAVEQETAAKGLRVLHTHDLAALLAEKGFPREPLKIVEVCNAKYASEALAKDVTSALLMPCPIVVYQEKGETHISTMLPSLMPVFFPGKGFEHVASELEQAVLYVVDSAAKQLAYK
jgi:Uncharacterized conserved protein